MEDEADMQTSSDSYSDVDFDVHEAESVEDHQKSLNVAALVRGHLVVKRQSLLRVLSVPDGAAVARRAFKSPCSGGDSSHNQQLRHRLSARKRFVPWGSSIPAIVGITHFPIQPQITKNDVQEEEEDFNLPPGVEPLVLWQPEETEDETNKPVPIEVEPLLLRFLRPHQREGVQFMFECVSGLHSTDNLFGCILADDMGLGKTLQSITLLYTLLRQGFDGRPMVKKAIIVTPTSLVSNWEAEINKWVGDKVQLIALCESSRDDVVSGIDRFTNPHSKFKVLIVSYETFRMHSSKFSQSGSCDLLICDEAHRLKNDQTMTNRALAELSCKRRILLSGTPMQNDLEEFYALVNFTNPGILGDATHFRRYYELPIVCGREPNATEEEKVLGTERSIELSAKVNQFILRRTNTLLSNHLPPKIIEVVCCKLSPLQSELYNYFIQSKNVKKAIIEEKKQSKILAYITALKKLCNHPKLIYDTIKSGKSGTSGMEGCMQLFPSELHSGRSGGRASGNGVWLEMSGKMNVLACLLAHLRKKTDDRIVLVSNYTQTLDLFAQLCRERMYPFLRLDGTTSISKRQKLVNRFNDPSKDEFAFLLSSKAGGCGLNLIGGNRLVLFDPDWNPANDKQAAARVWRDGQKKRVYIYRFLSTGTIEEKVYQRQMSKEGLQKVIQREQGDSSKGNLLSAEDLHDLFSFRDNISTPSRFGPRSALPNPSAASAAAKNYYDFNLPIMLIWSWTHKTPLQKNLTGGDDCVVKIVRTGKKKSEIHEKMKCVRCSQNGEEGMTEDDDRVQRSDISSECCKEKADIGGFAELAGCLHSLKDSERQVGSPLEEDLCNWGHHESPSSVPDVIFQASAGDEVSFVFTNQVDGKLVPKESMVPKATRMESTSLKENINPQADMTPAPCSQVAAQNSSSSLNQIFSSKGTRYKSLVSGNQFPFKRPKPTLDDDIDDFQ